MSYSTEKIPDIVSEMEGWPQHEVLGNWPKRLRDAYERQLSGGSVCTMSCREDGRLLERYARSEKRLLAALKPILDFREEYFTDWNDLAQFALETVRKSREAYFQSPLASAP